MQRYPQVLMNVAVADKDRLESAEEVREAVRAAEDALGDAGRVLVRPSGTEALVRVMVEAQTEEEARGQAYTIAEAVRAALGR
jgi:phosphoglucosamine mutase